MWAQDVMDEDSVDYVNRIRETANKPLHEMIEELSQWQRTLSQSNRGEP